MSNQTEESQLIELTGLWLNETKSGKKYFSGTLGGAKLLIFVNEYKEKDAHPDYKMFIAKKQKKEEGQQQDNKGVPF